MRAGAGWRALLPVLTSLALLAGCAAAPATRPQAAQAPVLAASTSTAAAADALRPAFEAALQLLRARNYAAAIAALRPLAEQHPQFSGPQAALGIAYAQSRQPALARERFARAVDINPDNAAAWLWLGSLRREAGDLAGAEQAYLAALRLRPEHAPTHWNLALLYELSLRRPDKALQHYRAFQRFAPKPLPIVTAWMRALEAGDAAALQMAGAAP